MRKGKAPPADWTTGGGGGGRRENDLTTCGGFGNQNESPKKNLNLKKESKSRRSRVLIPSHFQEVTQTQFGCANKVTNGGCCCFYLCVCLWKGALTETSHTVPVEQHFVRTLAPSGCQRRQSDDSLCYTHTHTHARTINPQQPGKIDCVPSDFQNLEWISIFLFNRLRGFLPFHMEKNPSVCLKERLKSKGARNATQTPSRTSKPG